MIDSLEILDKLNDILRIQNCDTVADAIDKYLSDGTDDRLLEKINILTGMLMRNGTYYSFRTRDGEYTVKKRLIEAFIKRIDDNGNPIIEINPIDDGSAQFKNNPIKNLILIYSNEDQRDEEYEKLRIILEQ